MVTHRMFQSALRSEERSDWHLGPRKGLRYCFNPRFAPKSEAIGDDPANIEARERFNPRFAPKSEAIWVRENRPFAWFPFQSALRSEERSDALEREALRQRSRFNPRFAPKSEAMRR